MRKNIFVVCFLTVGALNILALLISVDILFIATKPWIVLLLIDRYKTEQRRSRVFMLALMFCLLGDVLLLFTGRDELFFMGGLVAFLVGHVLYIIAYRQHQQAGLGEELLSTQKFRFALPVVLAGTGLITILFPSLGDLRIPVMIYAVVLMIMVITALLRYGRTTSASYWQVLLGAMLFMISDSLLAVNKFLQPFQMASVSIMVTYIAAQYFIVEGIFAHRMQK
jgi:uncharacterized membrane protein YhhN